AVFLAAQAAFAVAVVGQAAADAVGADAREAQSGAVAAAAAAAQGLEAHAAVTAGVSHARAREVAHGVAGALLQRDAEQVALSLASAQRLEQAGLGDERAVVGLALGARVAARGGLAAGFAFLAHVAGDRLAGIAAGLVLHL